MSNIQLTESELAKVVENAAKKLLSEGVYVNLDNMPKPAAGEKTGPNYDRIRERLKNGKDLAGAAVNNLKYLGYTDAEIQQAYNNGAISYYKSHNNGSKSDYKTRRFNRIDKKFRNGIGYKEQPGQRTQEPQQSGGDNVTEPQKPQTITKTVYYKSPEVGQIQEILNNKYQAGLSVDNTCGPLTIKAILNALSKTYNPEANAARERMTAHQEAGNVSTGTQQTVSNALKGAGKIEKTGPVSNVPTQTATASEMPKTIPTTNSLSNVKDVGRQMSQIVNNTSMSPEQKINSINVAYNNAKKQGGLSKDEINNLKEIRDTYIRMVNGQ